MALHVYDERSMLADTSVAPVVRAVELCLACLTSCWAAEEAPVLESPTVSAEPTQVESAPADGVDWRLFADLRFATVDVIYDGNYEVASTRYAGLDVDINSTNLTTIRVIGSVKKWMLQLSAEAADDDAFLVAEDYNYTALVWRQFSDWRLGFELGRAQWTGTATFDDRIGDGDTQSAFTSTYTNAALLVMPWDKGQDAGLFYGLRYMSYTLPAAVGLYDSTQTVRGVVYDPDMRHDSILLTAGWDGALAHARRTSYLGLTGNVELSLGATWMNIDGVSAIESATGLDADDHEFATTLRLSGRLGYLAHGRLPWQAIGQPGAQLEVGVFADYWYFITNPQEPSPEPGDLMVDYYLRLFQWGSYLRMALVW